MRTRIVLGVTISLLLPAAAGGQTERWTLARDLRIGSVDAVEESLTPIRRLVVGEDGTIYVVQSMDDRIRVFDRAGRFIRSVGRHGDGPGEFRNLSSVTLRGDTLVAFDMMHNRLSLFGPDGSFLRTLSMRVQDRGPYPNVLVGAALEGDRYLALPLGAGRTARPILLVDGQGITRDTVMWEPPRNDAVRLRTAEGRGLSTVLPRDLADHPLWVFDSHGRHIVIVERPFATDPDVAYFRVTRLTSTGDTVFSHRLRYTPRRLTEELRDSLLAPLHQRAQRLFTRAEARRQISEVELPEFLSPVTDLVVGRDGTTWLRLGGTNDWMVLDERGYPEGRVTVPDRTRIHQAERGTIWTTTYDDLDVSYVERFRVTPARDD